MNMSLTLLSHEYVFVNQQENKEIKINKKNIKNVVERLKKYLRSRRLWFLFCFFYHSQMATGDGLTLMLANLFTLTPTVSHAVL